MRECSSSIGHRQGSASSTILSLDNLVTTVLNTVNNSAVLLALDAFAKLGLAEKGDDGDTGVAADHGDDAFLGVSSRDTAEETRSTDDVEGCHTEEATRVEDAGFLEGRCDNGNGGVNGVGDDEDVGFGRYACDCLGKITNDGSICLK